jgi:hypothetical protein
VTAIALAWLGYVAADMASVSKILWPISLVGVGNAFIWGPLTATANRNLDVDLAGVGSGVYNTTRQVGGVLGSAIVGVFMQHQVDRYILQVLPPGAQQIAAHTLGSLPEVVRGPFAHAMGTSLYVPAIALAVGFVVVQFLTRSRPE